jgi:hypothetical protein
VTPRRQFGACRGRGAALLCFAAALPAQVPAPVPVPVPPPAEGPSPAALLQRWQQPQATAAQLRDLWLEFAPFGAGVRHQAFDALLRRYETDLRTWPKARDKALQRFAKAVPKAQQLCLGKRGETKVATARSALLAISRTPDLTKERIHQDCDPLLHQLTELLLPTVDQVLAADAQASALVAALRTQTDELRELYGFYLEVLQELDQEPTGRRHADQRRQLAEPPRADAVDAELELLCLQALPLSGRDAKVLEANAALRSQLDAEEWLGTFALNRIRVALGLPTVLIDEKLGNAARDHSHDMHEQHFFSHESPVPGKRSFGDRASRAGTSASAENIAAGHQTGASAIEGWWYSPGHHKNMLGSHGRTGLGRFENLWTQMFGG